MHNIHDDFDMLFTSVLVNSILYHIFILIHQQYILINSAISYILLTNVFAHHLSYGFSFFIIVFFPMIISTTFSSSFCVAAQRTLWPSLLLSDFTMFVVVSIYHIFFWPSYHHSAWFMALSIIWSHDISCSLGVTAWFVFCILSYLCVVP